MTPFNLEQAKTGAAVVTRDGKHVELLKFDMCNNNPLVGVITKFDGLQYVYTWTRSGSYFDSEEHSMNDLFMAPVDLYVAVKPMNTPEFAYYTSFASTRPHNVEAWVNGSLDKDQWKIMKLVEIS